MSPPTKQTPRREFDVAGLTDRLLNSTTLLGGGMVPFGDNEALAQVMVAIVSLECPVHAWDYASAIDRPVDVGAYACELDRLAAFTGRVPVSGS